MQIEGIPNVVCFPIALGSEVDDKDMAKILKHVEEVVAFDWLDWVHLIAIYV